MKVLQLTPLASARVTHSQMTPGARFTGSVHARVGTDSRAALGASRVTLEALVPRGGRADYGLLGFAFEPAPAPTLDVEVRYSEGNGAAWPESLAHDVDDVRLGLPLEYAGPVLSAATSFSTNRFPPGKLVVVEAGHGAVGSSAEVFRRLTLATLSLMPGRAIAEEELISLLRGLLVE